VRVRGVHSCNVAHARRDVASDQRTETGGGQVSRTTARWLVASKGERAAVVLADRHYSRRKVGSPQFMPPGNTLVLLTPEADAVWGWWRPDPASGIKAMNGLCGWTCTIFRNESSALSSELVLEAERMLVSDGRGCGVDGMLTYVHSQKVRGPNPGFCFKCAGWTRRGMSVDRRKVLLWKPFELAGVSA
jgi:hypothetical protein